MASLSFFKKNSRYEKAMFLETWSLLPFFRKIKGLFNVLCVLFALAFAFGFLANIFEKQTLQMFLGVVLLICAVRVKIFLLETFVERLKKSVFPYSFEVYKAIVLFHKRNLPSLFTALLATCPELSFVLVRALLNKKSVLEIVEKSQGAEDFSKVLEQATQYAQKRGKAFAAKADLFAACFSQNKALSDMLSAMSLETKDIARISLWLEKIEEEIESSRKFWLIQNLRKKGSLARSWSAGYTITLDRFGADLGEIARAVGFPRAVGHDKELLAIDRVLSRTQLNNVLLVGEPGSGRKSIIMDLASRVETGEATREISYKRVVELNLVALAATLQGKEEFEVVLDTICREATNAGDVILFLDEFHNFVGKDTAQKAGAIDITGILSPYLASSRFQVIASTTYGGLHQYIEQNPSLVSLFEKVEVAEISEEESFAVLEMKVPLLEKKSKRFISYPALRDAVSLSVKYVQGDPLPEKAIRLLDEAVAYLSQTKEQVLLPGHIAHVLREKTQIPIGDLESSEKEKLLNLEDLLHQRIIDQEEAIREVSSALRRARTEIASRKGPMGVFLFLGPTGVGKTETAKALAALYFGSESRMVRLDMSEFQNLKDIDRLLGTAQSDGLLTTPVRENPFSLVLLDEFEKGHASILNLFLQVFDDGHVTDGSGRKVSFTHTIIIATSNAGYQLILEAIREKKDFVQLKGEMISKFFQEGTFRPELINRFDSVVLFKPLEREHLIAIAGLMLSQVKRNLEAKGIEFVITDALKAVVAELGYDPTFGARNMRRVIQDKVENALATAFLKDSIKRGDTIEIDPASFTVISK